MSHAPSVLFELNVGLQGHYRLIGRALLEYEEDLGLSLKSGKELDEAFQSALVFVPLQVLESYLEDLLNARVSFQKLFLSSTSRWKRTVDFLARYIAVPGALLGIIFFSLASMPSESVEAAASASGRSILLSNLFIIALTGVAGYLFVRSVGNRRLRFAQIVSQEVSRRRGDWNGANPKVANSDISSWWFSGPSAHGAAFTVH